MTNLILSKELLALLKENADSTGRVRMSREDEGSLNFEEVIFLN